MVFRTTILAVDPKSGELLSWDGPNIEAISKQLARHYCDTHGLGYLKIEGIVVAEVDQKSVKSSHFDQPLLN